MAKPASKSVAASTTPDYPDFLTTLKTKNNPIELTA